MSQAVAQFPRTQTSYRRGKSLDIGCTKPDCQEDAGSLEIRDNGDVVLSYRQRHRVDDHNEWHHNTRSLREMLLLIGHHDIRALRNLLGEELVRKLVEV